MTERCVFRLTPRGLELIEVAPGVDLERDILSRMAFAPIIAKDVQAMDPAIFAPGPMGLRDALLQLPLAQRFEFDADRGLFFVNFEGLTVRGAADVEAIRAALVERLDKLGQRVPAMVDYDNFVVAPDALDAYSDMVRDVANRYYLRVTRYTTSAFLRSKLGEALRQRDVAPHIFESARDAHAHLSLLGLPPASA